LFDGFLSNQIWARLQDVSATADTRLVADWCSRGNESTVTLQQGRSVIPLRSTRGHFRPDPEAQMEFRSRRISSSVKGQSVKGSLSLDPGAQLRGSPISVGVSCLVGVHEPAWPVRVGPEIIGLVDPRDTQVNCQC
jgi:hypothetical protein